MFTLLDFGLVFVQLFLATAQFFQFATGKFTLCFLHLHRVTWAAFTEAHS